MINISLEEAKAVQDLEEQHRKLIKVLGATHKYLSSVVEHPVFTYNKDAQQVATRALEVMAEELENETA